MIYEEFLKTSHEDVQTITDKSFHFLGQEMTIFLFKGSHSFYEHDTIDMHVQDPASDV